MASARVKIPKFRNEDQGASTSKIPTHHQSMLENEFFPTPIEVIKTMLDPHIIDRFRNYSHHSRLKHKAPILEPNGGSGAILDYLHEELNVPKRNLLTIELNQDLRYTLQGKGYKVIGTDFLEYDEPCTFGFIVMNPPFSDGVKHVLKAWELLADGGDLVALVNAETIRNAYTKERELLNRLIKANGSVEYLGQCFKEAERSTDVEVALIRMQKPQQEKTIGFDGIGFDVDESVDTEAFSANPLAHRDVIKNLVARYNVARKILIDRHQSQSKLDFYLDGISSPVYESVDKDVKDSLEEKTSLNDQLSVLKSRFWNTVFVKTKMGNSTTSDFQKKFSEFATTQSAMAFTEDNVREVLALFFLNRGEIMQECIVKVFDEATKYHAKNVVHTEGWKTNKSYKLNKRIIMPWGVTFCSYGSFSPNDRIDGFLNDLDKVMCYLSGVPIEEGVQTWRSLSTFCHGQASRGDYQAKFESRFFSMKIFKKGTLHLDFLDLELLKRFNKAAAEGKNWIGDGS